MSNKLNFTRRLSPFKSVRSAICFPVIRPVTNFWTQGNQIAIFSEHFSVSHLYFARTRYKKKIHVNT